MSTEVQPLLQSNRVTLEPSKPNVSNHEQTTRQTEEPGNHEETERKTEEPGNHEETERKTKKEMKKLPKATVEIMHTPSVHTLNKMLLLLAGGVDT